MKSNTESPDNSGAENLTDSTNSTNNSSDPTNNTIAGNRLRRLSQ